MSFEATPEDDALVKELTPCTCGPQTNATVFYRAPDCHKHSWQRVLDSLKYLDEQKPWTHNFSVTACQHSIVWNEARAFRD